MYIQNINTSPRFVFPFRITPQEHVYGSLRIQGLKVVFSLINLFFLFLKTSFNLPDVTKYLKTTTTDHVVELMEKSLNVLFGLTKVILLTIT